MNIKTESLCEDLVAQKVNLISGRERRTSHGFDVLKR